MLPQESIFKLLQNQFNFSLANYVLKQLEKFGERLSVAQTNRIVQESTKDQGGLLNSCIREGKKLTESFQGRSQDFSRGTPNFPNPP